MIKKGKKYLLIRYDRLQDVSSGLSGKIIMRRKTCNGFLETIFKSDLHKWKWEIQINDGRFLGYSFSFNDFEGKRIDAEVNEKISKSVTNILMELEGIKNNINEAKKKKTELGTLKHPHLG